MTPQDSDGFMDEMRRLTAVFNVRRTPAELGAMAKGYFQVLRKFPLAEVTAKAEQWIATETKFPKPAEWAGVVVRRALELPVLSDAEARVYRRAEALRYEDEPCGCALCVEAGVSEKPLRFVPEFTEADTDRKVLDPIGNRVVTAGHWAHGWELQRLYVARANFWNRCYELGLMTKAQVKTADRRPLEERLQEIFRKRASR